MRTLLKTQDNADLPKKRKLRFSARPLLRRKGKERPRVRLIRRDPFGNIIILKQALISLLGVATYSRFNIINKMKVEGSENLFDLPKSNVLFVSNHQTYYADVIALYHIFCSARWRLRNINLPFYLLRPHAGAYYIAAEETMKDSGILPKIFSYAGAVTVKRAWRHKGKEVQRNPDVSAPAKIKTALDAGWVINFPQGTTSPHAPLRRGTANLIRTYNPVVVPVYIDGFRRAFDKKGLRFRKRGVTLRVKFSEPKQFGPEADIEEIQAFLRKHLQLPEQGMRSPEEA